MKMAFVLGGALLRMQKRADGLGTQIGGTTHLTNDLAGKTQGVGSSSAFGPIKPLGGIGGKASTPLLDTSPTFTRKPKTSPIKDDVVNVNPDAPRYGMTAMDDPNGQNSTAAAPPAPAKAPLTPPTPMSTSPAPAATPIGVTESTSAPAATPAPGSEAYVKSLLGNHPSHAQNVDADTEEERAQTAPTRAAAKPTSAKGYVKDEAGYDIPGSNKPGWKPPVKDTALEPGIPSSPVTDPNAKARQASPVQVTTQAQYGGGTTRPMLSITGNVAPPKDMARGGNLNAAVRSTYNEYQNDGTANVVPSDLGSKQRMFKSSAFALGYQLAWER